MSWSDWFASLPLVRTRKALADATRTLRDKHREIDALRTRVQSLETRLDEEKRKLRRMDRREAREGREHPLLIFHHIPKTAGSTFRRSYLTQVLAPEERWILSGGEMNARDRERFLALPAAERARIRIVAGHDAEALRPDLPDARFITVIRDPIERTISSYLHARFREGGEALWPDVRARGLSLAQFSSRYIPRNPQSRVLLGQDYGLLDASQMRDRLRSRYALVGYTEAFNEFVFLLHHTEGLPLSLYANRLVSREREAYVPSAADLDLVRRRNTVDLILHRVVEEEFQARVDALSDDDRAAMCRFLESLRALADSAHAD
jgi:hypothetical protein